MEQTTLNTQLISAKTASELSYKAAMETVNKCADELVPTINKAIERACLAALYYVEIDLSKYSYTINLADRLSKILKALGYETKLVNDDYRGYYLYISWDKVS